MSSDKTSRGPTTQSAVRIDRITARVIQGALENIAVEMGYKLMRMSHSSLIRESEDFGAAIIDSQGRQIAETPQSTPLQSGPLPGYIEGIRNALASRGEEICPGDVYIHNDAYAGASHVPDVAFCVPVFHSDKLIGFSATSAHHLDIGAHTPGSAGIVDAVDAYAEGLQIKGLKVFDRGVRNIALWAMLRDNIRSSDLVVGDMEAQIAACRIGGDAYLKLIDRYGLDLVQAAADEMMDYSERMMRAAIQRLPDGQYNAKSHIDGFLDSEDPARRELPIEVTITVDGSDLTVDFTGTARQVDDRPINMPLRGTVDCAVSTTLRSILLDSAVHGRIPQNSGLTRPVKIVAPKGTLVNPIFPAPTISRACPAIECSNTIMRRRRARLLEGDRGSVVPDARPALLGAQDRERLEQAAQEPAIEGKACSPGHLDGRDQERRRQRLRHLHRDLRRQIRKGGGMPGQGSRNAAGVLRLSRRALEAPADNQPHRKHIRHRATPYRAIQGMPLQQDGARHGLQAHPGGTKQLAPPRRTQPVAQADRRCKVHRRHRSRQATTASRRLTHTVTKIRRGGKKSIPHESRLGYNCACLLYATDGPGNCLIAGPISGTNVGA